MLSTIFIVRFLGPDVYANQIIDLAQLALLMIFIEVLPSSFMVFKVQDDRRWCDALIAQLMVTAVLSVIIVQSVGATTSLFSAEPWLVSVYALMVILKRFNDINLQAGGQANVLFLLDFATAALRLGLIVAFYALSIAAELTIWLSLILSAVAVQPIGIYYLRSQAGSLPSAISRLWLPEVQENWTKIVQYYPSTVLKRVADSMVPILAGQFLTEKNTLAVFLLTFRSLSFVNIFSRIFEALLNHRATLSEIKSRVGIYVIILGGVSHIGAFILSLLIIWFSGQDLVDGWLFVFVLTAMAWPNTAIAVSRAENFSKFAVWSVTRGYAAYIAVFVSMAYGFDFLGAVTPVQLAMSIVSAQICSWITMRKRGLRP